jgi:hypothetical protein
MKFKKTILIKIQITFNSQLMRKLLHRKLKMNQIKIQMRNKNLLKTQKKIISRLEVIHLFEIFLQ